MPRRDEDRVRAAAKCFGRTHRRVDPELPRLVIRGRDDASPVRVPADDQRLRAQFGILELLYGREEGIQIEVRDDHPSQPICTIGACSPRRRRRRRS